MNITKIECFDRTWNPVTGCYHKCPYCYARKYARRFGGHQKRLEKLADLNNPDYDKRKSKHIAYPYDFIPTFHRYRLDEPQRIKKQQNIFVCLMADLFGEWVTDEWIKQVFKACAKATKHRYLFLTKNYSRYCELNKEGLLPEKENMFFGVSVTNEKQLKQACLYCNCIDFLSVEPLTEHMNFDEWSIDKNGNSIGVG